MTSVTKKASKRKLPEDEDPDDTNLVVVPSLVEKTTSASAPQQYQLVMCTQCKRFIDTSYFRCNSCHTDTRICVSCITQDVDQHNGELNPCPTCGDVITLSSLYDCSRHPSHDDRKHDYGLVAMVMQRTMHWTVPQTQVILPYSVVATLTSKPGNVEDLLGKNAEEVSKLELKRLQLMTALERTEHELQQCLCRKQSLKVQQACVEAMQTLKQLEPAKLLPPSSNARGEAGPISWHSQTDQEWSDQLTYYRELEHALFSGGQSTFPVMHCPSAWCTGWLVQGMTECTQRCGAAGLESFVRCQYCCQGHVVTTQSCDRCRHQWTDMEFTSNYDHEPIRYLEKVQTIVGRMLEEALPAIAQVDDKPLRNKMTTVYGNFRELCELHLPRVVIMLTYRALNKVAQLGKKYVTEDYPETLQAAKTLPAADVDKIVTVSWNKFGVDVVDSIRPLTVTRSLLDKIFEVSCSLEDALKSPEQFESLLNTIVEKTLGLDWYRLMYVWKYNNPNQHNKVFGKLVDETLQFTMDYASVSNISK